MQALRRRPLAAAALVLLLAIVLWQGVRVGLAWRHWRQAQGLIAVRDFDAAQTHIAACLEFWPTSPDVRILAARNARLRKEPNEAFHQLDEARKIDGNAERIVLERYLLRAERGELGQVEKKLRAFLTKGDADAIFILDVLTYQWMMTHRFSEALLHLKEWARLQPTQREPIVRRAWVLERLRDFPAALADYQQALDLDPGADERQGDRVRLQLAELLLERVRPKDAVGHFETLLERQPKNPAVLFGLARCRLLSGQTDAGLGLLAELVAGQPKHGKALAELGRTYLELEKLAEAEGSLRQALEVQPHDKQTVFTLHQCLVKLGKRDEAKDLQVRLDRIRADEKRMAALMDDVQRSPEDPVHRQQIGELFLRNGLTEGLRWLNSALVYDENYAPAHEVLAEWWESRGAASKAELHRDTLARLGVAKKANRFLEQK